MEEASSLVSQLHSSGPEMELSGENLCLFPRARKKPPISAEQHVPSCNLGLSRQHPRFNRLLSFLSSLSVSPPPCREKFFQYYQLSLKKACRISIKSASLSVYFIQVEFLLRVEEKEYICLACLKMSDVLESWNK